MATLTNNSVASTYTQLLKITSEGIGVDDSAKYIEDGLGTDSALSLSTTRVGIGTASPDTKLHVETSDNILANFVSTDAIGEIRVADNSKYTRLLTVGNDFKIMPADGASESVVFEGDTGITYFNAGNVGIGTTSPASGQTGLANYKILEIEDTTNNAGLILGGANSHEVSIVSTGANLLLQSSGHATASTNNQIQFATEETNSQYSPTVRMTIDSSGNVGIGTASPLGRLHLANGDDGTGSNNKVQMALGYSDTNTYSHWMTTWHSGTAANNAINFYTGDGTEAGTFPTNAVHGLTIKNGNVGIGTTSPLGNLHVEGAVPVLILKDTTNPVNANNVYGQIEIRSTDGSLPGGIAAKIDSNDDYSGSPTFGDRGSLRFFTNNSTSLGERMRIDSQGNVGIGTSSPTTQVGASTVLEVSAPTGTASMGLNYATGSSRWELESDAGDDITISRNGTTRFKIDGSTGDTYTNDGTISSLSDEGIKKNVSNLDIGLDAINTLRPICYQFNGDAWTIDDNVDRIGFIAQEVEKVFPMATNSVIYRNIIVEKVDAVEESDEIAWGDELPTEENTKDEIKAFMDSYGCEYNAGDTKQDLLDKIPSVKQEAVEGVEGIDEVVEEEEYMTLSMTKMIPVLVKAVQELSAKVEALENK